MRIREFTVYLIIDRLISDKTAIFFDAEQVIPLKHVNRINIDNKLDITLIRYLELLRTFSNGFA